MRPAGNMSSEVGGLEGRAFGVSVPTVEPMTQESIQTILIVALFPQNRGYGGMASRLVEVPPSRRHDRSIIALRSAISRSQVVMYPIALLCSVIAHP